MAPVILSVIAFLALIGWRFVLADLWRGLLVREIDAPQRRHNGFLHQRPHILDRAGVRILAGNLANGSDGVDPVGRKYRAQRYLRRIVALTGATPMGSGYALDVGTARFQVRDRYVRRLWDMTDPQCAYEETCFYSVDESIPKAEQIATALLLLKNNPALFGRWAVQNGVAFKADGQVFTGAIRQR